MPDCLDRSAVRARAKAAEQQVKARAAVEQEAFAQEVEALRAANARVRIMLADVKFELALRALGRKYEGQPRTEIGRYTFGKRPTLDSQPEWLSNGTDFAYDQLPSLTCPSTLCRH